MLSDDEKLLLRFQFAPQPDSDDVTAQLRKHGQPAIVVAVIAMVESWEESFGSPGKFKNIMANMDEAAVYVAGLIGMM